MVYYPYLLKVNLENMEDNNTQHAATAVKAAPNYAIPFAIVIAGLAIAGAIYFSNSKNVPTAGAAAQVPTSVDPVTASDHILGNPDAKVVIVEYSDTECPFCKSFEPTLQRIMSEYGKDGKVALVYRHFPLSFHTRSPKEAEATECVNKLGGNTMFWSYITKIFEITPANNGLDPAELPKIAASLGIDVTAFNKCLNSGEMKSIVDADTASGTKAGVTGTPYSIILVDKKPAGIIEGAQPYETVKAQLDALLK